MTAKPHPLAHTCSTAQSRFGPGCLDWAGILPYITVRWCVMARELARIEEPKEQDRLVAAKEQLIARLSAEVRPEHRWILSRGELAEVVDAATQAYLTRHGIDANPLDRRDLVDDIIEALHNATTSNRAAIDAAKAQIQPLVLKHIDVAAAAEMPRAALERQLSGWVKDLLTESKIQLTLTERRELVESLIADIPGLESVPLRKERFEARISSEQKALFKRAAELQGRTLTDFVIASAHDAAVRTIEEMEIIRLSAADSRAFAEALLDPRQPPAELRAAAQRYRKMVGQ
jgi:uncharacterized protein (DUF1778 family)